MKSLEMLIARFWRRVRGIEPERVACKKVGAARRGVTLVGVG